MLANSFWLLIFPLTTFKYFWFSLERLWKVQHGAIVILNYMRLKIVSSMNLLYLLQYVPNFKNVKLSPNLKKFPRMHSWRAGRLWGLHTVLMLPCASHHLSRRIKSCRPLSAPHAWSYMYSDWETLLTICCWQKSYIAVSFTCYEMVLLGLRACPRFSAFEQKKSDDESLQVDQATAVVSHAVTPEGCILHRMRGSLRTPKPKGKAGEPLS